MPLIAIGFAAAGVLQLAGLALIALVLRDISRDAARGNIRRVMELRHGKDRQNLVTGTALYAAGVITTAVSGAILAASA